MKFVTKSELFSLMRKGEFQNSGHNLFGPRKPGGHSR